MDAIGCCASDTRLSALAVCTDYVVQEIAQIRVYANIHSLQQNWSRCYPEYPTNIHAHLIKICRHHFLKTPLLLCVVRARESLRFFAIVNCLAGDVEPNAALCTVSQRKAKSRRVKLTRQPPIPIIIKLTIVKKIFLGDSNHRPQNRKSQKKPFRPTARM